MSHRIWLVLVGLLGMVCGAWGDRVDQAKKPNVLLILVDDLRPAIRSYGDSVAITPNLDRLAARGVSFDRAYCNQAVCAPSRYNLMLGSRSTSTELYDLGNRLRGALPDAVTMPQYFSKHGYRTESLGKVFHVGHGNPGDPQSFDVPHFKDKVVEYVLPESTDGGQVTREEALFGNLPFMVDGKMRPKGAAWEAADVPDEAYADGRVAAEAVRRLWGHREGDQPFFMAVGFARPHLPFTAPKKYWDLYDASSLPLASRTRLPEGAPAWTGKRGHEMSAYKPVPDDWDGQDRELSRKLVHGYYASTSYMDAQLGKVLDALDRTGLAENTIVVLWGDHGFHLGELGIWTKHVNFEKATRIPLVVVAPGVSESGARAESFAETVDIFPTLAELAGLPSPMVPQPVDGVSLVSALRRPSEMVKDHAYHCFPKNGRLGRVIRTAQYRLVEWLPLANRDTEPVYELYEYSAGDVEAVNLAESRPVTVRRLARYLDRYPVMK